jgi:hypothetical protein
VALSKSAAFDADESHRIISECMKDSDRIGTTADASDDRVRQSADLIK